MVKNLLPFKMFLLTFQKKKKEKEKNGFLIPFIWLWALNNTNDEQSFEITKYNINVICNIYLWIMV